MGAFGASLGSQLGALGSAVLPIPGINGKEFGGYLGSFLPFKRGGRVRTKSGRFKKK